ncbi:uncharacterized protein METZ01_LOCUS382014, partial [marine metagenome]
LAKIVQIRNLGNFTVETKIGRGLYHNRWI